MKKMIIFACTISLLVFACKQEVPTTATAAPSNFSYAIASTTILKGDVGSSVAPDINNGGGKLVFTLNGTAVSGISVNSSTGVITWSSALVAGTYNIVILATNSMGSCSGTYSLVVKSNGQVISPSNLSYSTASSTIVAGTAGASVAPQLTNASGTVNYALIGSTTVGISINASTGIISWTNAVAVGTYSLSVQATYTGGSATTNYALTVTAPAATISFSSVILPVMTTSCGGCHTYTKTYAGITGHLTGCTSIQDKISTTYCGGSRMPVGANPLPATYIADFNTWIAQGKLNN